MSLLLTPTSSSTRTTWSYQLQFNFKFKKSPSLLNLRAARALSSDHRFRRRLSLRCVAPKNEAKDGSDVEKGANGSSSSSSSWGGLGSDVDWFGNSGGPNKKQGVGGILGVGLASVFLVAGITSAALTIGKHSKSRPRQEMKPLTEEQELSLTSGKEGDKEEDSLKDFKHNAPDDNTVQYGDQESKAGAENDDPSLLDTPTGNNEVELQSESEISAAVGTEASADEHVQSTSASPAIDSPDSYSTSPEFSKLEDTDSKSLSGDEQLGMVVASQTDTVQSTMESSSSTTSHTDSQALDSLPATKLDPTPETELVHSGDIAIAAKEDTELPNPQQFSGENEASYAAASQSSAVYLDGGSDTIEDRSAVESPTLRNVFASHGIPAPSLLSAALQVPPGKVLVPAVADQTQTQALSALQVLKVIENDAQAGDLCTRREYARWLVSGSSALSRNLILKVYPAMYIENVTELAFDDITPEDPDFTSIQGLAEAGLISSKLSRRDMLSSPDEDIGSLYFHPDSPLSRQDLVAWKMALEKRQLPEADKKVLHQLSGFIDIDRIDPDAFPALVADISAGEQGIVALAFGYTRLFQPDKPVTKGQAAIALATGEAADVVSEELARIEAESIADKAVSAHNALVAEVEKDINANFEMELLMEREKIDAVQKMADEARLEVEKLRAEREEQNNVLMKERVAVESQMEVLSRLRNELEEQLQTLMGNKIELSYEKERIEKLKKETEEENQAITRLQYELEVERKALSMARAWAEDEAKKVQEHAKALEEARDRWGRQGIKVVVDEDLREEAIADVTWSNVGKKLSLEETVERGETLTDKLKVMAAEVTGRSKQIMNKIIEKIQALISAIKEWFSQTGRQTTEFKDLAIAKAGVSVQELQQHTAGLGETVKEGTKRVVDDCREGVGKLTQRFKT